MSHKRRVWEEISALATRLSGRDDGLGDIGKQIGKLGREQFKANTLAEVQAERLQTTLDTLQTVVARQDEAQAQAVEQARQELLVALLPVLDGLEAALEAGGKQLSRLQTGLPSESSATIAMLAGWLEGVRLVRERLLTIMARAGVQPIPTVGATFDPYQHVAVGVVEDPSLPPGQIVGEERRGYTGPTGVLRYAEVVVARRPPVEAK